MLVGGMLVIVRIVVGGVGLDLWVGMRMLVGGAIGMRVRMLVVKVVGRWVNDAVMVMRTGGLMFVLNVELDAGDVVFLGALGVEPIPGETELAQLDFEGVEVDAEVEQRAQQHVAADAAEDIEIEGVHVRVRPVS